MILPESRFRLDAPFGCCCCCCCWWWWCCWWWCCCCGKKFGDFCFCVFVCVDNVDTFICDMPTTWLTMFQVIARWRRWKLIVVWFWWVDSNYLYLGFSTFSTYKRKTKKKAIFFSPFFSSSFFLLNFCKNLLLL